MDLNVTAYEDLANPRLIQAWTDAVQLDTSPSVFSTYEWCAAWIETVGRDAKPIVLVATSGDRTVGLFPLCVCKSDGVRWVKFLGSDHVKGDHLGLLCDPSVRGEVCDAFFDYLVQHNDMYDGFLLEGVGCDTKLHRELHAWARQEQLRTVDREIQTLPYIDLPSTFDGYLRTLSHKRRSAVRRSRRKLDTSSAEIRFGDGQRNLEVTIDEFCRLHAKRWNANGTASKFALPQMRSFLERFCKDAARHKWLRTYELVNDGRVVGVLIAFHFGGVTSFYQIGRDPESNVLNAGMMLMTSAIEQAIAESMHRFDFLRGDEPYKSRLAKSHATQATVMIGMRRPATTAIAKEQMAQGMKRIGKKLLGDERWSRLKQAMTKRARAATLSNGDANE